MIQPEPKLLLSLLLAKMAGSKKEFLVISYLNLRGQTGLPVEKQFQVENFLQQNCCDILHLQEAQIDDETFRDCHFI